jgi:hypothetical protein
MRFCQPNTASGGFFCCRISISQRRQSWIGQTFSKTIQRPCLPCGASQAIAKKIFGAFPPRSPGRSMPRGFSESPACNRAGFLFKLNLCPAGMILIKLEQAKYGPVTACNRRVTIRDASTLTKIKK